MKGNYSTQPRGTLEILALLCDTFQLPEAGCGKVTLGDSSLSPRCSVSVGWLCFQAWSYRDKCPHKRAFTDIHVEMQTSESSRSFLLPGRSLWHSLERGNVNWAFESPSISTPPSQPGKRFQSVLCLAPLCTVTHPLVTSLGSPEHSGVNIINSSEETLVSGEVTSFVF